MKTLILAALAVFAFALPAAAATPAQQRAEIRRMADQTLDRLYQLRPDVRDEIANAPGYAVFDSGSLAVLWFSGGYGHGIAHANTTGNDTFMEMLTGGVGIGLGVKHYNTVFVFHDPETYKDFVNVGLDLSANADLSAKQGVKGGANAGSVDVLPGTNIYQLTRSGLLAQLMLQGTKYWPDDDLNQTPTAYREPREEEPRYHYND